MPKTVKLDIPKDPAERELIRLTRENERLRAALKEIARRTNVRQGMIYKLAMKALDGHAVSETDFPWNE